MKKGLITFLSVFMLVALAACGGTDSAEIELSETSVTLMQNETMQLEATVSSEEEDTDQSVTWESSDEDVVAVNQDGEIGAMGGGTATVTVTSDVYEDVSASLDVEVLALVDYVSVGEAVKTLYIGEDRPIDWSLTLLDSSQDNVWEVGDLEFMSTNEDVVTVSEDGVLTPQSEGSAQIEVSAGNKFTYIEASVVEPEPVVQDALMPAASTDENLTLPSSYELSSENEFSVTWSSGNTDYLADDGSVTLADYEDGPQDVVLTANATSDDFDYTFEYTVTVGDELNDSISVARAEADDTEVTVTGVVHSYRVSEGGFFIQDDNGDSLFVYEDFSEDTSDFTDLEVGDEYVITGTLTTFTNFGNSLRQLSDATLDKVVSTENDYTVVDDMSAIDIATADHLDTGGVRYYLEDLEIADITSYGEMMFTTTGSAMNLKIELDEYGMHLEDYYEVGDTIDWMEFTVYDIHFSNLRLDGVVLPAPTEEHIEWYADETLTVPDETEEDLDLPDELVIAADYANPTTYDVTWESFNPDVIAHDGTVTQPTYMEEAVDVTLIRTVTIGETEYKTAHGVTVLPNVASDLFISEYIEGSSNNKAIEIFNGTGEDVDLEDYSVELYSNGSDTPTNSLDLTGTLENGEVYVIYNASAVAGIADEGDETSAVTYYNGDDALALLKDGTVLDVFGVIGTDPGSDWTVGDGSTGEHTLVRSSSVTGPTDTWDSTEWDVYPQDTFDYIGSHMMD